MITIEGPWGNCSDLRGSEGLKVENRRRILVADAHADGFPTAFDRFDPPSLNSYALGCGVSGRLVHAIMGFVPLGRGGGIGRHAVLRGPWAFACAGSNPALGTNLRDSARRGDVAKWLRRRSAKPLLGGSNPPVASIQTKPAGTPSRLPPVPPRLAGHGPGIGPASAHPH